jgi:DNA-binding NarL/FixJ family response regulator
MSRKKAQENTKNQVIREKEKLKHENMMLMQENEELKRRLAELKIRENFKKPKKLSEEDVAWAKEMRSEGLSHAKIGVQFGVTEGTIRNYLRLPKQESRE